MTHQGREILNRVAGLLQGIAASEEISSAITDILLDAVENIDFVLGEEDTE